VTSNAGPGWVDDVLLRGDNETICLHLEEPISRGTLRRMVTDRETALIDAGLRAGGSLALNLPPSLAFITNLLAGWRIGAQVSLLDHRLAPYEIARALERIAPQLVVAPITATSAPLRAFVTVEEGITVYPGRPAETDHAVIQLSSGSTGPSKVIGRTAADLVTEVERYVRIGAGVPAPGERVVVMASMVHVLGLVGGLLYGLHAGVRMEVPPRLTADSILATVARDTVPVTLLGVPFHIELLASVDEAPPLPQLVGMTTGGELVRNAVHQAFTDRYGVRLGNMYGMTEVGVIGTDLFGDNRPSIASAPGIEIRAVDGELQIRRESSPYVGLSDPSRWVDGWLHTKDAGYVDPETGLVTIAGRLDSQISIGGLKVDLTEVEHTLAALPEVISAVVVFDGRIEAYVVTDGSTGTDAGRIQAILGERLAAYKRPRVIHIVDQLPRTATGKLVRDRAALRAVEPA
jgi:3-hydroxy-4-methylanthranilate adenylyltransferase